MAVSQETNISKKRRCNLRLAWVRAGISINAKDYLYSSTRNYAELDSIIEVELLDLLVIVVK